MLTQRAAIINGLEKKGWQARLLDKEEYSWKISSWQIDELWLLESIRSPQGKRLYLTFLIDPQSDLQKRKKGEDVWAVEVSAAPPPFSSRSICLSLGNNWEQRLPVFMSKLAAMRVDAEPGAA